MKIPRVLKISTFAYKLNKWSLLLDKQYTVPFFLAKKKKKTSNTRTRFDITSKHFADAVTPLFLIFITRLFKDLIT